MSGTIAIIGAGIVGVSTAIWLQRAGHKVILIDRAGPGEGTSYGNGGVLASCSCVPVTGPGLIRKAPGMVFNPNQPLFLRWSYLPKLLPWLVRYLSHANADDTRRIANAVAGIVGDSLADHQALAEGTGAEKWIVPSDYVFIYRDRAAFEADAFGWSLRRENGFDWSELEGKPWRDYDPIFAEDQGFGVRIGNHGRISDPGQYVKDLAAHVVAKGGELRQTEITDFRIENGALQGLETKSGHVPCSTCVLATGVWSKPLMKRLGIKVPLESERGYHIELWEPNFMPRAPVMIASGRFVATPMDGRLRLAGVVEFGGLEAGPSEAPFDLLLKNAKAAMPGLEWKREERWMGHRPAPSDSIPVIGGVPGANGVFTGFGHHHIGLTGGPKTGRLLAQMISGQKPNLDVTVYSPARFATNSST